MSNHHNQNCHVDPIVKPVNQAALENAEAVYLAVQGMGCPRCAMRVQNGLLRLEGVLAAGVMLEQNAAAVAYDPERVQPADLVQAVSDAGNDGRHHYTAHVYAQMPARDALR